MKHIQDIGTSELLNFFAFHLRNGPGKAAFRFVEIAGDYDILQLRSFFFELHVNLRPAFDFHFFLLHSDKGENQSSGVLFSNG